MLDDDDTLFADEEDLPQSTGGFWKVLIIDDDNAIHEVTTLVLNNFLYEEKRLIFIHAHSYLEAKEVFLAHPDTAVILLDVVMEEDDSGLKFLHYVREELKNKLVRVILRTGQPGVAPELKIALQYEINDYKEKTELTATKLCTSIATALRALTELQKVEKSKIEIQAHAQQSIQEAENTLKLITDALPALISYVDTAEHIQFNNKTHEQWFGMCCEEISGKHISELMSVEAYVVFSENWSKAIAGTPTTFDMQINHKQLGLKNVSVVLMPHRSLHEINGCFCLVNDITERKRAEDHLNYLATHDPLTNIFNRTFFDVCLTQAIHKAERNKTLFAVLFIDLDKFKPINDTLGHHIGDLLLVNVAERLKNSLRKSDITARIGGDEFVVILEEIVSSDTAALLASKLAKALAQPYLIDSQTITISASIGYSIYPRDGLDQQALLSSADLAMYEVKQSTHKQN